MSVIMKNVSRIVFISYLMITAVVCLAHDEDAEVEVKISAKCAAVLIATGTTLGASTAYFLTPAALCSAGFCSTGVASGSFAAWWQSSMPLVASGSMFAQLQALAMAGAGIGTITIAAGATGGVAGATYLKEFCAFVDETDPDSFAGKTMDASVTAVTTAIKTKEDLVTQCSSSETCTATVDATTEMVAATGKFVATVFDSVVQGCKDGLAETGKYLSKNRPEV
jgi:hypothetical protein